MRAEPVRFRARARRGCEFGPCPLDQDRANRARERGFVTARDGDARPVDPVADAADAVRDRGPAACLRFDADEPERLRPERRDRDGIRVVDRRAQLRRVELSAPIDRDAVALGERARVALFGFAFARDDEQRTRRRAGRRASAPSSDRSPLRGVRREANSNVARRGRAASVDAKASSGSGGGVIAMRSRTMPFTAQVSRMCALDTSTPSAFAMRSRNDVRAAMRRNDDGRGPRTHPCTTVAERHGTPIGAVHVPSNCGYTRSPVGQNAR